MSFAALLLGESELDCDVYTRDFEFEQSKISWREGSNLGVLFKKIECLVEKSNEIQHYGNIYFL